MSKIVVAAKIHVLDCSKLLIFLYIHFLYLWKGKSLEFNSGKFQKDSDYIWTVMSETVFFPMEYSYATSNLLTRGNRGICLEQLRLFVTKCMYLEGLVYEVWILHPFDFVLQ